MPWGNGEQALNAAGLVADQAGILLSEAELTPDRLVDLVIPVITDPERLARMAELVRPHSPPDAADVLARAALDVVRGDN